VNVSDFLAVGLGALLVVPAMLWWTRGWPVIARFLLLAAVLVLIGALLAPQSIYLGVLRGLAVERPWIGAVLEPDWADHAAHFVLFSIAGAVFAFAAGPSGHGSRLAVLLLLAVVMEALQVGVDDHAVRLIDGTVNGVAALFGYGLVVLVRPRRTAGSDASA